MAENETVMEDEQKMLTDSANNQQQLQQQAEAPKQNQIDLREISIILDSWSRTCDTVLSTLDEQIIKIIKNNGEKARQL